MNLSCSFIHKSVSSIYLLCSKQIYDFINETSTELINSTASCPLQTSSTNHITTSIGKSKNNKRTITVLDSKEMQNGGEMKYYQEGLDFKPKSISRDGSQLVKLDQLTNFTNYNTKQPGGWLDKYES